MESLWRMFASTTTPRCSNSDVRGLRRFNEHPPLPLFYSLRSVFFFRHVFRDTMVEKEVQAAAWSSATFFAMIALFCLRATMTCGDKINRVGPTKKKECGRCKKRGQEQNRAANDHDRQRKHLSPAKNNNNNNTGGVNNEPIRIKAKKQTGANTTWRKENRVRKKREKYRRRKKHSLSY